ncbi:MAG: HD domain-containing protein [Bacteroidetes bacterium]|uniref:HD domain-containing protein n=1 Tax=Candidatus Cryptobacteroides intestinigallinarum TaxID=2840767 RepID=A0A9D9HK83_9BACT|nr:HD domain-containing protein [Candidatus Cryptobacteroides intestinigallinarum]
MGKRLGETGARPEETDERLDRIISFCRLIDKEKSVERRTYISDGSRFENDAEHAWHMAVMALLLSEYADEKTDVLKVVSMLLVHDLVEIYAGDTFAYDTEGVKTQKQREKDAANRLYAQLPDDLSVKFRGLWDEFEAGQTPEARFAHTLDNFQPLMLQAATDGRSWKEGGRRLSEVLRRNAVTPDGSRALWEYAKEHFIAPQLENGHLQKDTDL